MCQGDCLNQFKQMSTTQKLIEETLEKKIKETLNLSLNEFYVLYFLSLQSDQTMRLYDLQEKVGLTQSAMSRLIVRMEEKEAQLIRRSECCSDKRGVCIVLTELGKKQVATHLDKIHDALVPYHELLRRLVS